MISVLYVDDEPLFSDIVKLHLERTGQFQVDASESPTDALRVLAGKKYDAVVSDYQMPEMDGIEFLKAVRKVYPHIPFIVFTGRGREAVVIEALNNGADFYLQKGSDAKALFAELMNMIQKAVDRRRFEEELFASEERYRNVVQTQTEFITRFRPDGTHIFVNDAYCRYFGKTPREIIGRRFIPDIPKEDRPQLTRHFASLDREQPVAMIEHRIVMPDGEVRWQVWNDRAIFSENGDLVEYQSVGRDVTKRKHAEEALMRSEYLSRGIIDHLPDATFAVNSSGEVIVWNRAMEEMTGVPASEVIGKGNLANTSEFFGEPRTLLLDYILRQDDEILKNYSSIKRDGAILIAETPMIRFQDREVVLWGMASPLYDQDGTIIGAVESIRDITELKRS